jgi:hypothetical protein
LLICCAPKKTKCSMGPWCNSFAFDPVARSSNDRKAAGRSPSRKQYRDTILFGFKKLAEQYRNAIL